MTSADRYPYDEFSMFHENAAEFGIPYAGPPVVRRESVRLGDGRNLSALVSDGFRATGQLMALRDLGVSIVIDDFGTGYSSLSYLQQIPADVLKIDQAFVRTLATSEHDRKLARAIIMMAHDLEYRVVAEGVGDQAAFDLCTVKLYFSGRL